MLPPHDALIKHAKHTEPIVGSVYYLHEAPHHMVAMRDHGGGPAWMTKAEQNEIEANPGLHPVDMVDGYTSISRAVFEEWPKQVPIFRNSIMPDALQDPGTRGEVSHDYWFCLKAREFQVPIFINSSIVCDQLTLVPVGQPARAAPGVRADLRRGPGGGGSRRRRRVPAHLSIDTATGSVLVHGIGDLARIAKKPGNDTCCRLLPPL